MRRGNAVAPVRSSVGGNSVSRKAVTKVRRIGMGQKGVLFAVILLLPLGLFLLHDVQSDPDCHSKPLDACPCGLISLSAVRSLSSPPLSGQVPNLTLNAPYVVALHLLDPPPEHSGLS